MLFTERKFLLAIAISVSLLVVILGMRVPNYAKPLRSKSSTRAVLEVQAKETKEGLNKSGEPVALRGIISIFVPTAFYIDLFHHQTRCNTSILLTSIPARASPSVCS